MGQTTDCEPGDGVGWSINWSPGAFASQDTNGRSIIRSWIGTHEQELAEAFTGNQAGILAESVKVKT